MKLAPEEIGRQMDALGLWKLLEHYNFGVKPKGTVFPYFCTVIFGDGQPVKVRFLMLEGWQTLHDYIRLKMDANFGYYSSPFEMPHFELVVLTTGECRIFRHDVGYMPAPVSAAQQALVGCMLWEAYGIMMRLEANPRLLVSYAQDKALFARIETERGVWNDAPLMVSNPPPYTEQVRLPKDVIKKAQDLPFVREAVFEVDFRLLPNVMTKEPRPRLAYGLRIFDVTANRLSVDQRVSVNPESGLRALWEFMPAQFLNELVKQGRVPGEVKVCSGRVFRFLRPLCIELPFKLSLHDHLEHL